MDSCCEGCYYNLKPNEATNAIESECQELEKYIIEKLKFIFDGDYHDFWLGMFLAYALGHIYDEKGREGLREAEKAFIEQCKVF